MSKAEKYVEAGLALLQLGRMLQKEYAEPAKAGSQFDEDAILAALLPEKSGVYVDIGASFPIACSNTWRFYERGWRGLLIEPLSECWGAILTERREDRLCPMAASNIIGFASLRASRTVSSLMPDWAIQETGTIPVKTAPLSHILGLYKDWDWRQAQLCSIDVEGHEREVLDGFDWNTFRPKVIVIEYRDYDPNSMGPDTSGRWSPILLGQGYKLHAKTPLNHIWTL